jgi:hypothetical protein
MSSADTDKKLKICKQWAATEGVDKVIQDHGVDVIVAPADSFFAGVAVGGSEAHIYQCLARTAELTCFQDTRSEQSRSAMLKAVDARMGYLSLRVRTRKRR